MADGVTWVRRYAGVCPIRSMFLSRIKCAVAANRRHDRAVRFLEHGYRSVVSDGRKVIEENC